MTDKRQRVNCWRSHVTPRHPSGHGQKGTAPRPRSASAVSLMMPQDGEETEMLEDASLFRLADIVPSVMHHQQ